MADLPPPDHIAYLPEDEPVHVAYPLNRPPSTSDEESEFAPHVVPIVDANDVPVPPIIQFGDNFHVGESSSTRALLAGNSWVYAPGPIGCNLESVHRGDKRLDRQMFDRYKNKIKMAKKFKEGGLRINRHEYDITDLDAVVRKNSSDYSKMMKFVEGLSLQFQEEPSEPPIHPAFAPRLDDPYAIVKDTAIAARDDDVAYKVADVLATYRSTRNNTNVAGRSGGSGGQVATLGLTVANGKSWADMKMMMSEEFCPSEEIQRLENKLQSLKLRDTNIIAYTQRFNKLALLCPEAVLSERNKVELYIKGLPENIKGETTSSKPAVLNDAVRMAHTLMEQKIQDKAERVAESNKRKWESNNNQGGNATGRAYAIRNAEHVQGLNVVTELGAFNVIIGMDWLVECDDVIFYEKEPTERRLEDVLVILDFLEVFHDDLPGLPPPCQVGFRIELVPGAVPVAHAPYCFAPSEMKELSDKLKQLS
ncbi:putative reverse transcriptase domain-containing protein [Tanacetum coccineum]